MLTIFFPSLTSVTSVLTLISPRFPALCSHIPVTPCIFQLRGGGYPGRTKRAPSLPPLSFQSITKAKAERRYSVETSSNSLPKVKSRPPKKDLASLRRISDAKRAYHATHTLSQSSSKCRPQHSKGGQRRFKYRQRVRVPSTSSAISNRANVSSKMTKKNSHPKISEYIQEKEYTSVRKDIVKDKRRTTRQEKTPPPKMRYRQENQGEYTLKFFHSNLNHVSITQSELDQLLESGLTGQETVWFLDALHLDGVKYTSFAEVIEAMTKQNRAILAFLSSDKCSMMTADQKSDLSLKAVSSLCEQSRSGPDTLFHLRVVNMSEKSFTSIKELSEYIMFAHHKFLEQKTETHRYLMSRKRDLFYTDISISRADAGRLLYLRHGNVLTDLQGLIAEESMFESFDHLLLSVKSLRAIFTHTGTEIDTYINGSRSLLKGDVKFHNSDLEELLASVGQTDYTILFYLRRFYECGLKFDSGRDLIDRLESALAASVTERKEIYAWLVSDECQLFRKASSSLKVTGTDVTRLYFEGRAGAETLFHLKLLNSYHAEYEGVSDVVFAVFAAYLAFVKQTRLLLTRFQSPRFELFEKALYKPAIHEMAALVRLCGPSVELHLDEFRAKRSRFLDFRALYESLYQMHQRILGEFRSFLLRPDCYLLADACMSERSLSDTDIQRMFDQGLQYTDGLLVLKYLNRSGCVFKTRVQLLDVHSSTLLDFATKKSAVIHHLSSTKSRLFSDAPTAVQITHAAVSRLFDQSLGGPDTLRHLWALETEDARFDSFDELIVAVRARVDDPSKQRMSMRVKLLHHLSTVSGSIVEASARIDERGIEHLLNLNADGDGDVFFHVRYLDECRYKCEHMHNLIQELVSLHELSLVVRQSIIEWFHSVSGRVIRDFRMQELSPQQQLQVAKSVYREGGAGPSTFYFLRLLSRNRAGRSHYFVHCAKDQGDVLQESCVYCKCERQTITQSSYLMPSSSRSGDNNQGASMDVVKTNNMGNMETSEGSLLLSPVTPVTVVASTDSMLAPSTVPKVWDFSLSSLCPATLGAAHDFIDGACILCDVNQTQTVRSSGVMEDELLRKHAGVRAAEELRSEAKDAVMKTTSTGQQCPASSGSERKHQYTRLPGIIKAVCQSCGKRVSIESQLEEDGVADGSDSSPLLHTDKSCASLPHICEATKHEFDSLASLIQALREEYSAHICRRLELHSLILESIDSLLMPITGPNIPSVMDVDQMMIVADAGASTVAYIERLIKNRVNRFPSLIAIGESIAIAYRSDHEQITSFFANSKHRFVAHAMLSADVDVLLSGHLTCHQILYQLRALTETKQTPYDTVSKLAAVVNVNHNELELIKQQVWDYLERCPVGFVSTIEAMPPSQVSGTSLLSQLDVSRLVEEGGAGIQTLKHLVFLRSAGLCFASLDDLIDAIRGKMQSQGLNSDRLKLVSFFADTSVTLFRQPTKLTEHDIEVVVQAGGSVHMQGAYPALVLLRGLHRAGRQFGTVVELVQAIATAQAIANEHVEVIHKRFHNDYSFHGLLTSGSSLTVEAISHLYHKGRAENYTLRCLEDIVKKRIPRAASVYPHLSSSSSHKALACCRPSFTSMNELIQAIRAVHATRAQSHNQQQKQCLSLLQEPGCSLWREGQSPVGLYESALQQLWSESRAFDNMLFLLKQLQHRGRNFASVEDLLTTLKAEQALFIRRTKQVLFHLTSSSECSVLSYAPSGIKIQESDVATLLRDLDGSRRTEQDADVLDYVRAFAAEDVKFGSFSELALAVKDRYRARF